MKYAFSKSGVGFLLQGHLRDGPPDLRNCHVGPFWSIVHDTFRDLVARRQAAPRQRLGSACC